ncbi:hypothetical protein [Nocardioides salsibiostraticola]
MALAGQRAGPNGTPFARTVRFTDGQGSTTTARIDAGDITSVTLPR